MFFKFQCQSNSTQWEPTAINCLINAAAYTGLRFSPDVTKDGGNLQLRRTVRQCVNRGLSCNIVMGNLVANRKSCLHVENFI